MGDQHDPQRRAALYRLERLVETDSPAGSGTGDVPGDDVPPGAPRADRPGEAPRPRSMAARGAFADELVRQAMARGEFDDLPLTGKPIPGLTGRYDPDWWLKAFIEREQITGVLPEALQLRKDDAALDGELDRVLDEPGVRATVAEFNARVVEARRQLLGGPPVVTPTRDVDLEVTRWRERRRERQRAAEAAAQAAADARAAQARAEARGGWWRRIRGQDRGAGPGG